MPSFVKRWDGWTPVWECKDCRALVRGLDEMLDHKCPSRLGVFECYCSLCGSPKHWKDEPCEKCKAEPEVIDE